MTIAARGEDGLLPHQRLVAAAMAAPPPSPDTYVEMAAVDPLNLEEEEDNDNVFLDAVST